MHLGKIELLVLIVFCAFEICSGHDGTLYFYNPLSVPYTFREKSPFWLLENEVSSSLFVKIMIVNYTSTLNLFSMNLES